MIGTPNGKTAIFCAYAPHSGHPYESRQRFLTEVSALWRKTSCHGLRILAGDLNERLYARLPCESACFGEFFPKVPSVQTKWKWEPTCGAIHDWCWSHARWRKGWRQGGQQGPPHGHRLRHVHQLMCFLRRRYHLTCRHEYHCHRPRSLQQSKPDACSAGIPLQQARRRQ